MNVLVGNQHAGRAESEPDFDPTVIWLAAALLGLGTVMVYSASIAIAEGASFSDGQAHYYLVRHLISLGVGVAAAIAVVMVPMRYWQLAAPYLFMAWRKRPKSWS